MSPEPGLKGTGKEAARVTGFERAGEGSRVAHPAPIPGRALARVIPARGSGWGRCVWVPPNLRGLGACVHFRVPLLRFGSAAWNSVLRFGSAAWDSVGKAAVRGEGAGRRGCWCAAAAWH